MLIKQLHIHTGDILKIIGSIRKPRRIDAILIVIIHRKRPSRNACFLQFPCQPSGKGCLSCRTRSGDQNETHIFFYLNDRMHQILIFFLNHLFAQIDNIVHLPVQYLFIQLSDRLDTMLTPILLYALKRLKQMRLIDEDRLMRKPEPRFIRSKENICKIRCIRQHDAIKIIRKPTQTVNAAYIAGTITKQVCFILHPDLLEKGNRRFPRNNLPIDRLFLFYDPAHRLIDLIAIQWDIRIGNFTIQTVGKRIAHMDPRFLT